MFFPARLTVIAAATIALIATAQAVDVPNLDVNRTCRDAARNNAELRFDADRCLKSEHEARDQLAREWAAFTPADRTLCTQTATMGGTASYVELLTCLELKRDVAKLPPDRLTTRPSSMPAK